MGPILVLIIDDDPIVPQVLEPILKASDMQLISATSANLENIIAILGNQTPDIIIMEVVMKYQNGLKLVDILRRELQYTRPIIAISDHQNPELVARIHQSVLFNGYLPKPLDPIDLPGYLEYKIDEGKNPWSKTTNYE